MAGPVVTSFASLALLAGGIVTPAGSAAAAPAGPTAASPAAPTAWSAGPATGGVDAAPRRCRSALRPGTTSVPVRYAGTTYRVRVHVPPQKRAQRRAPLMLNLHPSSGNARRQAELTRMDAVADRHGFVVAYPQGVLPLPPQGAPDPEGNWAWNVPNVPTTAGQLPPPGSRDDVAFLRKVVADLVSRGCLDARRVYSTGFSGGARMSSALACHASDVVAAVAPVAGVRAGRPEPEATSRPEEADCRPARPVPVVTFHGYVDQVNPFAGNGDRRWGYSVALATERWAQLDGCRPVPVATALTPHVTRFRYGGCDRGALVERYDISDGGHTWPGAPPSLGGPGTSQEIDASSTIWNVVSRHRLR
ncbi:extracellular catalytic domain type 1 short-chain-length polyhydroxyalkanoate depolymerase [Agilicoccus flavus]|uniref:extracellular catalytic domain type 1 short-chain-length polyhydroxyalkanoate depolymerase n=1 Tax=Agilicoccus flavus TaxID=2775968 RepID=UPI001CF63A89|nr:PHB depolymerase family esterase [Agilicoccus flavus]